MYVTSMQTLFCDAFFILNGRLMFSSLHGREANVQALMAELTLGNNQRSFQSFSFQKPDESSRPNFALSASIFTDLCKKISKYDTHDYGRLTHVFLYAHELTALNMDQKSGWLVLPGSQDSVGLDSMIWNLVEQLADIPLLKIWQPSVTNYLKHNGHLHLYEDTINSEFAIYGLKAIHVKMPTDFENWISQSLKSKSIMSQ